MTSAANKINFEYPLLIAENFDDVLARRGEVRALRELKPLMHTKGQMLLQARGGAGKTFTADRIAELEDKSHGVAFVPALRLPVDPPDISPVLDIDLLVSISADPRRAAALLDNPEGLVVIDGINEIGRGRADEILLNVPVLTARHPFIRFLVTDRLTRRDVDQDAWLLATLGSVPERIARGYLNNATEPLSEHLTIPYYLDRSIGREGADSQVAILRGAIVDHGGVPESDLGALARAVFNSYNERDDRAVEPARIRDAVGDVVFEGMLSSDLLRAQNGYVQFAHHLTQDFLAALRNMSRTVRQFLTRI